MPLDKINVLQEADSLTEPLAVATLTRVEDFVVMVYICQGAVAWHKHEDQDELFFVQDGEIALETDLGHVVLREGEMAVVPRQTIVSGRGSVAPVLHAPGNDPVYPGLITEPSEGHQGQHHPHGQEDRPGTGPDRLEQVRPE